MTTDERLIRLETQFELFMEEAKQQREDIRRLHERQDAAQAKHDAEMQKIRERQEAAQAKHDAEMQKIRERQEAAQAKHDADMKEMNQRFYEKFDATDAKIDALRNDVTKELHSNFVQTMIGVGAIMATIGGLIIAALK